MLTTTRKSPNRIPQISLKLVRETVKGYKAEKFVTPESVAKFLQFLKDQPEEHFVAVFVNAKNEPIGFQEISHGTVSASLVHPREVFKAALLCNAHAMFVAHNHPSGDTRPSVEDIKVTKTLLAAGKLLGVSIIDHLIIGDDVYSFRENYGHMWMSEE